MRITRSKLRRTIRRVLQEGVQSHLDGNLLNLVFAAAQDVAEEYGDITVQDVEDRINRMGGKELEMLAEPVGVDDRLYIDMWMDAVSSLTYETIVDYMFRLVDMGELADGYEDFFTLAKA